MRKDNRLSVAPYSTVSNNLVELVAVMDATNQTNAGSTVFRGKKLNLVPALVRSGELMGKDKGIRLVAIVVRAKRVCLQEGY